MTGSVTPGAISLAEKAKQIPLTERQALVAGIKPEARLHDLMKQVFERMGATWVEVRQGADEFGKDVIARFEPRFGKPDFVAVVAKLGKVYGRADGRSSLATVLHQIDQAFSIPAASVKEGGMIDINYVIVACTGELAGNARTEVAERARKENRRVDYWEKDKLTELLTEHLPEFFFDMDKDERAYLLALQTGLADLSQDMRRYGRTLNFSLDDVFVNPRVAVVDAQPKVGGQRPRKGKSNLINLPHAQWAVGGVSTIIDRTDSLCVMAPAGAGKSTLLRKAAHELCRKRMTAGPTKSPLPVWLSATKIALTKDDATLLDLVATCSTGAPSTSEVVSAAYRDAGIVVFVDDQDMVQGSSGRERVRKCLEQLSSTGPKLRVITASRLTLFDTPTLIAKLKPAFLFPFRVSEVKVLLERILGVERAPKVLEAFLRQNQHSSLPQTPLVVTLLALLHQHEASGELPANIAELYRMVSEVFLGKWSEANRDHGLEKHAVLAAVARSLAYQLQTDKRWALSRDDFARHAAQYLRQRNRQEKPEWVVAALLESGLLVQLEGEGAQVTVSYCDRSFQEYFAAAHLVDHPHLVAAAVKEFADPWWSNVVMFLAGLRRDAPDMISSAVAATEDLDPQTALIVAMQFGRLLQAASLSPTVDKTRGIVHATDLVQYFYGYYAERLDSAKVSVKLSRTSLIMSTAVLFAIAFDSRHLTPATRDAALELLSDFDADTGERRLLKGIRALCASAALAAQGEFSALSEFIATVKTTDYPFFGPVALVIESCVPPDSAPSAHRKAWNDLVRNAKRLTPPAASRAYGPDSKRGLKDDVRKLTFSPQLFGVGEPSPEEVRQPRIMDAPADETT